MRVCLVNYLKKKYKGEYAMCVTFPSGNAMNKPKANVLVGT